MTCHDRICESALTSMSESHAVLHLCSRVAKASLLTSTSISRLGVKTVIRFLHPSIHWLDAHRSHLESPNLQFSAALQELTHHIT
jgi:hypothetical protein